MSPVAASGISDGITVLVVPCYNEAERLRPDAFLAALERYDALHLLMVDDGSRDGTRQVLQSLASRSGGRVAVLSLSTNSGKAEAVRQGLLRSLELSPAFVGYWDADLSTPFEALSDFLHVFRLRSDIDVVLGSRVQLLGRDIRRTPARHYFGRVFATGTSLVLGLPVYDTQCGAKLFRTTVGLPELLATPFSSRWMFDVELLSRYLDDPRSDIQQGRAQRIYELALRCWIDEPGSKVRAKDGVRAFFDLVRIRMGRRHRRAS